MESQRMEWKKGAYGWEILLEFNLKERRLFDIYKPLIESFKVLKGEKEREDFLKALNMVSAFLSKALKK